MATLPFTISYLWNTRAPQLCSCVTMTTTLYPQRQTIEMVPLTHAFYTYSGKDYNFYVYGMENKVFASKYPSACSIL